jgi:YaiO family outer membrane protein
MSGVRGVLLGVMMAGCWAACAAEEVAIPSAAGEAPASASVASGAAAETVPIDESKTPINQTKTSSPAANVPQPSASGITEVELPADFSSAAQPVVPVKAEDKEDHAKRELYGAQLLPYEVEVGTTYSTLNNGYGDWSGFYINAEMKLAERNNVYCEIRQTSRFSKSDTEVRGGFYDPINDRVTVIVEVTASNTHLVLPERSIYGMVEYEVNQNWDVSMGGRHFDYNFADLNLLTFGLEHYWGNYRVSYTRNQGYMLGHGMANSNLFQLSRYYGDMNWVGITALAGRELETLVTDRVTSSKVLALAVSGSHSLTPRLALTYALGNYRQGNFYVRNGVQLGLRRQF